MFNLNVTHLLLATLSLTATTTAIPITDTTTTPHLSPRYELGGINIQHACLQQNGLGWEAVRLGEGIGDWKCRRGTEWRDVNMNAACSEQYKNPEAWAKAGQNVWDWKCHV